MRMFLFYVLDYTDCSPTIKKSLNRDVEVDTNEEDATAIFDGYDKSGPKGTRTQPELGSKNEIKIDKRTTFTPARMPEC